MTDLATAERLLRTQWDTLLTWLEAADLDDDTYAAESTLSGWTVGELVSHLGRAMDALAVARSVPAGTNPMSLAEYLGTYPARADEITAVTRELDTTIRADRLAGVKERGDRALDQLTTLAGENVVQARRGPITLRDMVVSRLLELVIHGDDLARSLPGVVGDPIDRDALQLAATELLKIVIARGGWHLELADARLWVRLAAGRRPYDVDDLAHALRPTHTAGGVPDLGRMLPLL